MSFKEEIRKNRPNLSESSINTYNSILTNLAKKMNVGDKPVEYFKQNYKKVLEYLKDMDGSKRKTVLASLVVLTGSKEGKGVEATEHYRTQMMEDANHYNDNLKNQDRRDNEKENWISQNEVLQVFQHLYKDNYHLFSKSHLTPAEHRRVLDTLLLGLYVLIPPRRSLDYTVFKIRNIDKDKDNYMNGRQFFFNRYKTDKVYHQQAVRIPARLHLMVKKWTERSGDNEFLLHDYKGKPFTVSRLTLELNHIFGKKISVNLLRKIYLTEKYKSIPALRKLEETAREMGHDFNTAITQYVKKDVPKNEKSKPLKE